MRYFAPLKVKRWLGNEIPWLGDSAFSEFHSNSKRTFFFSFKGKPFGSLFVYNIYWCCSHDIFFFKYATMILTAPEFWWVLSCNFGRWTAPAWGGEGEESEFDSNATQPCRNHPRLLKICFVMGIYHLTTPRTFFSFFPTLNFPFKNRWWTGLWQTKGQNEGHKSSSN